MIKFIKNRLMSFSMIGSVGFLLLVGLIINSVMDVLNARLLVYFPPDIIYLFYTFNLLVVFAIITLLFTLIFKTLPDGRLALRDCLIGASFTTFCLCYENLALVRTLGGDPN